MSELRYEQRSHRQQNKFFEVHFDVAYDRRSDVSTGFGRKRVALPRGASPNQEVSCDSQDVRSPMISDPDI
ncbi:hypothetical protein K503DRAFT_777114 [Rhizopogon vinicolor AM-OR11-026]|uniref:Uncharacterized protein n=1 Tax=Rhizopogon vinicolor AM-OR11-026 TaxID=1314800 RepID=A0A1B7MH99_9AGAM|nr:hypothetical protein K503DRAFT_777114 [Rhizopogon vinicolor AM-OR11-026]